MDGDANPHAKAGALFAESAGFMEQLRGSAGCPWDREQTPDSIRKYTLEETYEVLDAIERRDWPNLCEELGDLLLQVLFYAQMAREGGHFKLADVVHGLNRKLVRRHPHVFGEEAAAEAGNRAVTLVSAADDEPLPTASVLANWSLIKKMEKIARKKDEDLAKGLLDLVPRAQGSLLEAHQLGGAAAAVGFDWPNAADLLEKVREEAAELELEVRSATNAASSAGVPQNTADAPAAVSIQRVAEEFGDLLFTVANLGRHLQVDPEIALRDANAKFRRRFAAMETMQAAQPTARRLEELTAPELEQAWASVKAAESVQA